MSTTYGPDKPAQRGRKVLVQGRASFGFVMADIDVEGLVGNCRYFDDGKFDNYIHDREDRHRAVISLRKDLLGKGYLERAGLSPIDEGPYKLTLLCVFGPSMTMAERVHDDLVHRLGIAKPRKEEDLKRLRLLVGGLLQCEMKRYELELNEGNRKV